MGSFMNRATLFYVLLYSQKGVNPQREVFIQKDFEVKGSVSIWKLFTSSFNKRQRKRDDMAAMRRRKLHFK